MIAHYKMNVNKNLYFVFIFGLNYLQLNKFYVNSWHIESMSILKWTHVMKIINY